MRKERVGWIERDQSRRGRRETKVLEKCCRVSSPNERRGLRVGTTERIQSVGKSRCVYRIGPASVGIRQESVSNGVSRWKDRVAFV